MRAGMLLIAIVALSGCSSFRTQAVDRMDNDTLVVNPNSPLKGIPVSLRVPTHLELNVVETTYWEKQDIPGERPTLKALETCRPTRTVIYTVKETEKIFLVDPMRPGAGTESYGFDFQSSDATKTGSAGKGHLKKVTYKVDDKTITESANLLSKSLGLINALQTSAAPQATTSTLIETQRSVAYTRVDINSPTFECDVEAFLDLYVNTECMQIRVCPKVCESNLCQSAH